MAHIIVHDRTNAEDMIGIRIDIKRRREKRRVVLHHQLEEVGMTMSDLAKETGVSLSYISRIVSGARVPGLDTSIRLSQSLSLTLQEFADILLPPELTRAIDRVPKPARHVLPARIVPGMLTSPTPDQIAHRKKMEHAERSRRRTRIDPHVKARTTITQRNAQRKQEKEKEKEKENGK